MPLLQTIRYQHILVPLDGSEVAAQAVPHAAALAKAFGAAITLFHVVPREGVPSRPLTQKEREAFAQIDTYMQRLKGELEAAGIETRWAVTAGEPAAEIVRYAYTHNVDAVVMSTHGKGGTFQRLYGSVADAVLARLTIPVVLIRPKEALRAHV
ncbi:MAG: universal stress protein [Dehalococcoidia bacterium]|nr:universal stress protein [Dehalococcoidia bacterium]MDW8120577.1 universal stress protein [Chloroflexota bacterium]